MNAKSIPSDLQNLLSDLDFLGQITQGKKPCMNDMTFVESSSWFGAFKRYKNGESREMVIQKIRDIINRSIDAIQTYNDEEFMKLIILGLSTARKGIQTLIITYKSDPKMISKINVLLSNINLQLQKNNKFITDSFSKDNYHAFQKQSSNSQNSSQHLWPKIPQTSNSHNQSSSVKKKIKKIKSQKSKHENIHNINISDSINNSSISSSSENESNNLNISEEQSSLVNKNQRKKNIKITSKKIKKQNNSINDKSNHDK